MWQVSKEGYCIESNRLSDKARKLIYQLYIDEKANVESVALKSAEIANISDTPELGKLEDSLGVSEPSTVIALDIAHIEDDTTYVLPHSVAVTLSEEDQVVLNLPPRYGLNVSISNSSALTNRCDFRIALTEPNGNETRDFYREGSYIELGRGQGFILPQYLYTLFEDIEQHNRNNQDKSMSRDDLRFANYHLNGLVQRLSQENPLSLSSALTAKEVIMPDMMRIQLVNNGDGTYRFELHFDNQEIDDDVNQTLYTRGVYGNPKKRYAFDKAQQKALRKMRKLGAAISKEEATTIAQCPELYFDTSTDLINLEHIGELSDRVLGLTDYEYKAIHTDTMHNEWVPDGFGRPEQRDTGSDKINLNAAKVLDILDNTDEDNIFTYENHEERSYQSKDLSVLNSDIQLKDYQYKGVEYLQNLWIHGYKGALLADDMGLGKTLQTLTFAAWAYEQQLVTQSEVKPIMVVAPVSLLQNWIDEYIHFIDSSKGLGEPLLLYGSRLKEFRLLNPPEQLLEKYHISDVEDIEKNKFLNTDELLRYSLIITNYETVRDYQLSLALMDCSMLILDEAQKIKNPTSRISQAIKGMKYDFGLAMTGTPVENSWVDLWTIIDFCEPNKLGILKEFNDTYIKPIAQANRDESILVERGEQLKANIKPLLLRRMKQDVLGELPQKEVYKQLVPMTEEQWQYYLAVAQRGEESFENRDAAFAMIQKLRAISLHPYLLYAKSTLDSMKPEKLLNSSSKLQAMVDILDSIREKSEKVLIFVRDKKIQSMITNIIEARYGLQLLPVINGDIIGSRRQKLVKDFNSSKGFNVLILSAEAGGVGLNITSANHVIHLSREWNPAKEDQATDRVYRIGQEKTVHVYYPLAIGRNREIKTFDEVLDALLERKRSLSQRVIVPSSMSDEEGCGMINSLVVASGDSGECTYLKASELRYFERSHIISIVRHVLELENCHLLTVDRRAGIDIAYENDGRLRLLVILTEDKIESFKAQYKHIFNYGKSIYASDIKRPVEVVYEICTASSITQEVMMHGEWVGVDDIWDIEKFDDLLKTHRISLADVMQQVED